MSIFVNLISSLGIESAVILMEKKVSKFYAFSSFNKTSEPKFSSNSLRKTFP